MALFSKKGVEPPIWRKSAILFAVMTALFFLVVGLFFGQSFQPERYQSAINLYVVDFDNGAIGKKLLELTSQVITTAGPGWFVISSVQYPNGLRDVSSKVANGDAWGAIVANPGATKRLEDAFNSGSANYNPNDAITFFYDEGRSPKTIMQYVVVPMRQLAEKVSTEFGSDFLRNSNGTSLERAVRGNPRLVTSPVSYKEVNLHPNNAPVVDASLSFGQVFLIVFCFATAQAILQLTGPLVLSLELSTLLSLRVRIITVFVIGVALWYTLLHTALGVQFTVGNWFAFWFLNALQMFVHVFSLINIALLVGRNSAAFPLLFLIVLVLNATAGLAVIELGSEFYRWGYAMPMWNAVTACRTLIFGSYNRLSLNIGLLFAWFIVLLLAYIWIQLSGREFDDEDDDRSSFYANPNSDSRNDISFSSRGKFGREDYEDQGIPRGGRRPIDNMDDDIQG